MTLWHDRRIGVVVLGMFVFASLLRWGGSPRVAYADTLYSSDFEQNDGGWVASGFASWEHGVPVPGVYEGCDTAPSPEPSGAHSGTKVWATNLDGCYANANSDTLLSQTFDFSNATGTITMRWWHFYHVFETFDYAIVRVNGTQLWRTPNSTASAGWVEQTIDLSAYAGNPSVQITFLLHATTVVNRMGWYIDDVAITSDAAPTATPTDTPTDTPTPTNTPTDTPTNTPTGIPTDTPTDTPTGTPTATAVPPLRRLYLPLVSR
ncbi:MAG TPA: hypothetical protein VGE07_22630 [Herpetosiphonaceae bacterium]